MGCVREAIAGHCWNAIGSAPTHAFRRAVEDGVPNRVDVEEYGLGDIVSRLFAGARRLPLIPTGTVEGTGQYEHRVHDDKFVPVTVDGETHYVMKPIEPDVGFVHTQRAAELGNAQLRGPHVEIKHGAMACDTLIALVRGIVGTERIRSEREHTYTHTHTLIPLFMVDVVVEVPRGAHPSDVLDVYERDVEFSSHYESATRTVESFDALAEKWIHGVDDRASYLDDAEFGGPPMSASPTPREQLLYNPSLKFEDENTVFTGFHWPIAARLSVRLGSGSDTRSSRQRAPQCRRDLPWFDGGRDVDVRGRCRTDRGRRVPRRGRVARAAPRLRTPRTRADRSSHEPLFELFEAEEKAGGHFELLYAIQERAEC